MKFTVFYQKDISSFIRSNTPDEDIKKSNYKQIVQVDIPRDNLEIALEILFRQMNVVDGTEIPVALKCRSMSVGDVAVDPSGQAWIVDMAGYRKVEFGE